jgi:hypothetical protein
VAVTWKSASGRSTLHADGASGEARLAVDTGGERAVSERLTVEDLQSLLVALEQHLSDEASWSS